MGFKLELWDEFFEKPKQTTWELVQLLILMEDKSLEKILSGVPD